MDPLGILVFAPSVSLGQYHLSKPSILVELLWNAQDEERILTIEVQQILFPSKLGEVRWLFFDLQEQWVFRVSLSNAVEEAIGITQNLH